MENTKMESIDEKVHMGTLVSCLNRLNALGFKTQFKATAKGLLSLKTQKVFQPNQIKIVHFYRFEGESDPADSSIVYAVEVMDGEKGTLVDGYGPTSDAKVAKFIQQVEEIQK